MINERFPNWDVDIENGTIYSLYWNKYIGRIDKDGYVQVGSPRGYKHYKLHHYIWICANGCDIPEGFDIHHIDGNRQNNSIYNLELIERHKHLSEHKKGITLSEEHKIKLSESLLNRKDLSKQVAQYTLNGELVKVWDSVAECGRNGFNQGNVCSCCNGRHKTHKGFIWKYYNEEKDVA